jgi:hypothetical protein
MRPMVSVDQPKDADYADFVDCEANPIAFVRLLGPSGGRRSTAESDSPNSEQ